MLGSFRDLCESMGHFGALGLYTSSIASRDGIVDLIVPNYSSTNLSVLLGNGDGTFQGPITYTTSYDPHFVTVGDFNGDAKKDVAVTEYADFTVNVFWEEPSLIFLFPSRTDFRRDKPEPITSSRWRTPGTRTQLAR